MTATTTPTMPTTDQLWSEFQSMTAYSLDALRDEARARLNEELAGTGHGISSSDVNHTCVAILRERHADALYSEQAAGRCEALDAIESACKTLGITGRAVTAERIMALVEQAR